MTCSAVPRVALLVLLLATPSADAAERERAWTERLPVEAGDRVLVDAASLDLVIRTGDLDAVHVTPELHISGVGEARADDWIARHTPTAEAVEDGVRVHANPGKGGFLGLGLLTARARIRVVAPASTRPDLTTSSGSITLRGDFPEAEPLRLRTTTGDMEMVGAAHSLEVHTAAGDARLEVVRPLESFFGRTSSGNISLEGGARRAEVDTASGDVYLAALSGSVVVTTSTGRISLRWDRLEPDDVVKVRSTSGRIHLILPETVQPSGRLTTVAGSIRSDFPGRVNEDGDTVELSGRGPRLEVETASGELVVSRAVAWDGPPVTPVPEGPPAS